MNFSHSVFTNNALSSCLFFPLLGGGLLAAGSVHAADVAAPALTVNSGDNAWLLGSSALVLMMTAPGLILFYGGLVRTKNVLSTMMHSLILMALVSEIGRAHV